MRAVWDRRAVCTSSAAAIAGMGESRRESNMSPREIGKHFRVVAERPPRCAQTERRGCRPRSPGSSRRWTSTRTSLPPQIEHRFDCKDHSQQDAHPRIGGTEVEHHRILVHRPARCRGRHHLRSPSTRTCARLPGSRRPRPRSCSRQPQRVFRRGSPSRPPGEPTASGVGSPTRYVQAASPCHPSTLTVISMERSITDRAPCWKVCRGPDVVHRGANASGESSVPSKGGHCPVFLQESARQAVQLNGGDSRGRTGARSQTLFRHAARAANARDIDRGLEAYLCDPCAPALPFIERPYPRQAPGPRCDGRRFRRKLSSGSDQGPRVRAERSVLFSMAPARAAALCSPS